MKNKITEPIDFNNIEAKDDDGRTPFINACIQGDFDTAKALVKAGANINAVDNEGKSASHYTILHRSNFRSARFLQQLLVKRGAELSIRDSEGYTPLMLSVKSGYFKKIASGREGLVKILIAAGVDVNVRNSKGLTALLVALTNGNIEMAELLIDAGAGPMRRTDDDWDLTINAVKDESDRRKIVALLDNRSLNASLLT